MSLLKPSRVRLILVLALSSMTLLSSPLSSRALQLKEPLWVPQDYSTIQEGIDRAQPGDVINVDATQGPYEGPIVIDKKLTLASINGRATVEVQSPDEDVISIVSPYDESSQELGIGKSIHEGFESGDFSALRWETGEYTAPWTVVSTEKHSGNYSAKAGPDSGDSDSTASTLRVTLDVAAGEISFYLKVNPNGEHAMKFCAHRHEYTLPDGSWIWSGHCILNYRTSGWEKQIQPVPLPGTWKFEWLNLRGDGQIWIDDIEFPPLLTERPPRPNMPVNLEVTITGFEIRGGNRGIFLRNVVGNTIQDNLIKENKIGIGLENAYHNEISGNEIIDNGDNGVSMKISWNNMLHDNKLVNNGNGIMESWCSGNTIRENLVQGSYTITRFGIGGWGIVTDDHTEVIGNVVGNNGNGISVNGQENILEGNTVTENNEIGIEISSGNGANILRGNTVSENKIGIALSWLTKENKVEENIIAGNRLAGIQLEGCTSNSLKGNLISGSRIAGIWLYASVENILESNQLQNNRRYGILLEDSRGNTVYGNTAESNAIGFSLKDSSAGNTLEGNTAKNNQMVGIQLEDAHNNHLTDNLVADNMEGISIATSLGNELQDNRVLENRMMGISLHDSEENTLKENVIEASQIGIRLDGSSNIAVLENQVKATEMFGIQLENGFSNVIKNNAISSNLDVGISLESSEDNHLESNEISYNGGNGIQLLSSSQSNTLKNNVIESNFIGVFLDHSDTNTVEDSSIRNNKDSGIKLQDSAQNVVSQNIITSNDVGIVLHSASENILEKNAIEQSLSVGITLGESSAGNIVRENDIKGNIVGIRNEVTDSFFPSGSNQNQIRENNIVGNRKFGAENRTEFILDAEENWWGDPSGPRGEGPGMGDAVSDFIDFDPWLTEPVESSTQEGE